MKRQKKFKNAKLSSFFDEMKAIVIKKAIAACVVLVFVLVTFVLVKAFLYRSDYFRLRVVEARGRIPDQRVAQAVGNYILNSYKGRNIFNVDLKSIAQSLEAGYPDAKDIVVRISPPDKIVASMQFREAIAVIKNDKICAVDADGVMLYNTDPAGLNTLPEIYGINIRYDDRKRRAAPKNLTLALELLKEIKKTKFMKAYGLSRIDAQDGANLSFFLANGVEIKIGYSDFKQRLDVLGKTLKDPRLVLDKIKYIDLRFNDIYISPK